MKRWILLLLILVLAGGAAHCNPSPSKEPGKEPGVEFPQESIGDASDQESLPEATSALPALLDGPLTAHVDPFIGTGGAGFAVGSSLPGATAPFGMVKISPDTASAERGLAFQHCAGYYYLDKEIVGFSHIHLHGTGVPDYGNLLVMPVTGEISAETIQEAGYRSTYSHDTELATPGYYAVTLERPKTRVELTATTRTAYHRYTYEPTQAQRFVLLRLDHALPGGKVTDGALSITSDKTIEGWLHSKGAMSSRGGGFELYFVLRAKDSFVSSGTWKDGKLTPQDREQKGGAIGAWFQVPKQDAPFEFQVGISFVSIAQARKNLETEQAGWDFAKTHKDTEAAWEKLLQTIRIAGGTKEQRRIFYTSMYHSFQMPTILSDVDGQYRGFDKEAHQAKGFTYYSDFSMWDTYRTLHPLLVLLTPDRQRDMVHSLLAMAKEGGDLPRWPLATGYTGTMVGASADIVIADTYLKGIKDFDVETAYQHMRRLAMKANPKDAKFGGRSGIEHYVLKGYVDAGQHDGSASITMEYAYNDFAIAQLAKALGKQEDATLFGERARNYRHLWEPTTQFFRAKDQQGKWLEPFDALRWTKDYVEGTAWQYLWFVPHDPEGLATLFGDTQKLFVKLDEFFKLSKEEHDASPRPLSSRKYYWHGNEPDLHAAMVYLQLGKPHKTHEWVRWIMASKYDDTPAGLVGNDDCGTLSAWYIFNAVGLYPIPGRDLYLITSPIFPRSVINVAGKRVEILAPKTSDKAIYVTRATLNGKALPQMWLKHTELLKDGNVLQLEMSETPPQ